MPYKAAPPDLLATQHSAWVITCYLPFFAVRCSEASAGQTRRFLPWIVTNLSTFLAGRPLARQHGQRAGTDPTSPSPFAPASRRAEARARAAQPCGAGGSHPVPTSPGRKYMQSPPRRKKKKKATSPYPLPTPLLLLEAKLGVQMPWKMGKTYPPVFPRQTAEISTSAAVNSYLLLQTKYSHIQSTSKSQGAWEKLSAKH